MSSDSKIEWIVDVPTGDGMCRYEFSANWVNERGDGSYEFYNGSKKGSAPVETVMFAPSSSVVIIKGEYNE